MDEAGEVATIVEDHVESLSVLESSKGLFNAPEVLLLSLALPSIDRNTRCGDTGKKIRWHVSQKRSRRTQQRHGLEWRKYSGEAHGQGTTN